MFALQASFIPPHIDADSSELDVWQKLIMRDLKVHPALRLLQSPDQPVCSILGSRAREEEIKISHLFSFKQTHRYKGHLFLVFRAVKGSLPPNNSPRGILFIKQSICPRQI